MVRFAGVIYGEWARGVLNSWPDKAGVIGDTILTVTNEPPSVEVLGALYIEAGFLKEVDPNRLAKAICGTSRWWTAQDGASRGIVGIGRCLTDWARYACIYDVIVQANRQGEGIGTAIMHSILRDLLEADIDTIHLWPSKGKVPFYQRLGFWALSEEQPVMKLNKELANKAVNRTR